MDKDKILEKARNEYKEKDLVRKELQRESGPYMLKLLIIVYMVLIIIQMITGKHEESIHVLAWGMICGQYMADFKMKKDEQSFIHMLAVFAIFLLRLYIYIEDLGLL